MSDPSEDTGRHDFQRKLEVLGLDAHWTEVGEKYGEYRERGIPKNDALEGAIYELSEEYADREGIRLEFIKEQHRYYDHSFEAVVEIPEKTKELIERRMKLFGKDPEEDREAFIDYALEHVEIRFECETDDD